MFEKIEECPVCKSNSFKNYLVCTDHTVSQESFAIVTCNQCGFKLTNPRPQKDNLGKYYQSEDYISHSNKSNNPVNLIYKIARFFTLRKKVKFISQFKQNGLILDYGCGTGEFLNICQKNGWQISGVEPSPLARSYATTITKTEIAEDLLNLKKETKYDIITLWHVLEHIYDLNKTIKELIKRLENDGTLIIAVPNHLSKDAMIYKEFWAGYDVPRHLYHFDQESIKKLMQKHKMKLINIYPQKLDAFYVSLLSEKFKNKKNNFFKAFKKGWESNKFAKTNNQNYSSIIYAFKKG